MDVCIYTSLTTQCRTQNEQELICGYSSGCSILTDIHMCMCVCIYISTYTPQWRAYKGREWILGQSHRLCIFRETHKCRCVYISTSPRTQWRAYHEQESIWGQSSWFGIFRETHMCTCTYIYIYVYAYSHTHIHIHSDAPIMSKNRFGGSSLVLAYSEKLICVCVHIYIPLHISRDAPIMSENQFGVSPLDLAYSEKFRDNQTVALFREFVCVCVYVCVYHRSTIIDLQLYISLRMHVFVCTHVHVFLCIYKWTNWCRWIHVKCIHITTHLATTRPVVLFRECVCMCVHMCV